MCILLLGENGLEKYRLSKKWEQFKIVLLFMNHPVYIWFARPSHSSNHCGYIFSFYLLQIMKKVQTEYIQYFLADLKYIFWTFIMSIRLFFYLIIYQSITLKYAIPRLQVLQNKLEVTLLNQINYR